MGLEDLNCHYEELRSALEDAYLAPVWDSERIDQLADHIRSVELALGKLQAPTGDEHGVSAG